MGPTPYKWLLPELDLHLSRAPFPGIPGMATLVHGLHCTVGTSNLAPEAVPGASLHTEALSPECGRECQETGDCGRARHVRARQWGLLGPTAHGLLGR